MKTKRNRFEQTVRLEDDCPWKAAALRERAAKVACRLKA